MQELCFSLQLFSIDWKEFDCISLAANFVMVGSAKQRRPLAHIMADNGSHPKGFKKPCCFAPILVSTNITWC